jgi:ATP-dependent Clp protease ATP-binding subunit ClpC
VGQEEPPRVVPRERRRPPEELAPPGFCQRIAARTSGWACNQLSSLIPTPSSSRQYDLSLVFEKFTELARQVVVLAQQEARALRHNYIGTEHILLGLLRVEEGVAARALRALGVTVEEARDRVSQTVGTGEDEPKTGQVPFTPRAKKVLELGMREALALGHNHIGTEHILLGLVRENNGVAARVLLEFEVDADRVRSEVIATLPGVPRGTRTRAAPRQAARYRVETLTGAGETWADQLNAWNAKGWTLVTIVAEGKAFRTVLERRA